MRCGLDRKETFTKGTVMRWPSWKLVAASAIIATATGCYYEYSSDESADLSGSMNWVQSKELSSTDVVPHTEVKITPGRNVLYCSTFQMAWSELQNDVIGEPIRLTGSPRLADQLNAGQFSKDDLSADSYLAKAGLAKDGIVDEIRREMQERFPNATLGLPPSADDPSTVIVAYAYLVKSLPFETKFDKLRSPIVFQTREGGVSVKAFGIDKHSPNGNALRSQIRVIDYKDSNDFVLELKTTQPNEQLVLAKVAPAATLEETLAMVHRRAADAGDESPVKGDERFRVPNVAVAVTHHYAELIGRRLLNDDWNKLFIDSAEHAIGFSLDEAGAEVESHGYISKTKSAARRDQRPRSFIFDRPFLVYLKQRDAERPYLALWVETAEVLKPVEGE